MARVLMANNRSRLHLVLVLSLLIVLPISHVMPTSAAPYGTGSYGACQYQECSSSTGGDNGSSSGGVSAPPNSSSQSSGGDTLDDRNETITRDEGEPNSNITPVENDQSAPAGGETAPTSSTQGKGSLFYLVFLFGMGLIVWFIIARRRHRKEQTDTSLQ